MMYESHETNGLKPRTCDRIRIPHFYHKWTHDTDGEVHCSGRNPVPSDAVEKYCTPGCFCEHCTSIRKGIYPEMLMCTVKWKALTPDQQSLIHESVYD